MKTTEEILANLDKMLMVYLHERDKEEDELSRVLFGSMVNFITKFSLWIKEDRDVK